MRPGLRTVLRLRELVEQRETVALAHADRTLRAAHARSEQERARHERETRTLDASDVAQLMAQRVAGSASLEAVAVADDRVLGAARVRDERAAARTEAAVRRRSLERLLERIEAREAEDAARRLQREADELAVMRWGDRP